LMESIEGAILLAKRGNCFFHQKAMNAEDAGAVALIVYNDDRPPVESMEGVEELVPPRILTIFVHADVGQKLLDDLGEVVISKVVAGDGLELSRPITTKISFRCGEEWQNRRETCQPGDHVDVKLWVKMPQGEDGAFSLEKTDLNVELAGGTETLSDEDRADLMEQARKMAEQVAEEHIRQTEAHARAASRLQNDGVGVTLKLLRAMVVETYPHNASLLVQWLSAQEQDPVLGSIPTMQLEQEAPVVVSTAAAFRDGITCAAEPTAFIEKLLEPYSCQAELVVHVASLCAHPRLAPPRPRDPQAISCVASDAAREKLTEHRQL